jgi:hypothetical protein
MLSCLIASTHADARAGFFVAEAVRGRQLRHPRVAANGATPSASALTARWFFAISLV